MSTRRNFAVAAAITTLAAMTGCAVTRKQESVGAYIDDATITTGIKARFAENKEVDATNIHVETLNGTVLLSGFAKSPSEKANAETLAWKVSGVKAVKNEIALPSK